MIFNGFDTLHAVQESLAKQIRQHPDVSFCLVPHTNGSVSVMLTLSGSRLLVQDGLKLSPLRVVRVVESRRGTSTEQSHRDLQRRDYQPPSDESALPQIGEPRRRRRRRGRRGRAGAEPQVTMGPAQEASPEDRWRELLALISDD